MKHKYTKHCVSAGVKNDDADFNNIIFTIKDTKLYALVSKLLSKGFERSVYWNAYKTKKENKSTATEYRYFRESNFVSVDRLFALIYLNRDNDIKSFKS